MAQRHRDLTGLGAALVAHALALAWIAARHLPPPPRFDPAHRFTETVLDLAEDGAAEPPPAAASRGEPAPGIAANPPGVRPLAVTRAQPRGEALSPVEPAPQPPAETAPPLAGLSADALGIGTHNPFLAALPESAPHRDAPRPDDVAPGAQQALRDGIHARDHELGLDIGGPLVVVAEEITRPSATPVNSQAHFEVTADATGHVTSVRLLDASEGYDAWSDLSSSFQGALRDRPLRVPAGARGVAVTVEVTSRVQLPSGFDPGMDVSILNIPLKKAPAEQKRPRRVEILKIEPKIEEVPPDPTLNAPVKLPQYRVQLVKIFGLAFDPADIGASAQRVVHARVLREQTL